MLWYHTQYRDALAAIIAWHEITSGMRTFCTAADHLRCSHRRCATNAPSIVMHSRSLRILRWLTARHSCKAFARTTATKSTAHTCQDLRSLPTPSDVRKLESRDCFAQRNVALNWAACDHACSTKTCAFTSAWLHAAVDRLRIRLISAIDSHQARRIPAVKNSSR